MALELTKNQKRVIEWLKTKKDKMYHNPLEKSYQFTPEVTGPLYGEGLVEVDGKGGCRIKKGRK